MLKVLTVQLEETTNYKIFEDNTIIHPSYLTYDDHFSLIVILDINYFTFWDMKSYTIKFKIESFENEDIR
ncbi:hypothetical protein BMR1_03g04322 [Babesia microti strain RI]|uniref:Uncharacterized protein n=1 Tax=Babesia microti (strain RI) TaxID=1133968 RepID=A0A1R4ACD8_BABMR|nr:hypothetical protein BMR1_03g04322 [Babesia microti strain RI]SJK86666.1 hypothetical protein BMR1_03g04322 [Babesia microti strain RI]|eukprot:XP_021338796.1 hypothetical protein BMR1_03g04322 [Babesia microti strain RI]